MTTVHEQLRILLWMTLCGAGFGAAYDGMRLMQKALLRGRAMAAAMDICFGAACALGIIGTALWLETDAFRWYILLGTLAGMGIYRASIGALVRVAAKRYAASGKKNQIKEKSRRMAGI